MRETLGMGGVDMLQQMRETATYARHATTHEQHDAIPYLGTTVVRPMAAGATALAARWVCKWTSGIGVVVIIGARVVFLLELQAAIRAAIGREPPGGVPPFQFVLADVAGTDVGLEACTAACLLLLVRHLANSEECNNVIMSQFLLKERFIGDNVRGNPLNLGAIHFSHKSRY